MKQRARRLVVSRSIERKPEPHPPKAWFVPLHRYVHWLRCATLEERAIGRIEMFEFITSKAIP